MANIARTVETEALAGLVERVTFHNPDSAFCVLRVKARGQRELITVVGHAATVTSSPRTTAPSGGYGKSYTSFGGLGDMRVDQSCRRRHSLGGGE